MNSGVNMFWATWFDKIKLDSLQLAKQGKSAKYKAQDGEIEMDLCE